MKLFGKSDKPAKSYLPDEVDLDALVKDYLHDIEALVEAVLAGDQDVDLLLAEMVEGAQDLQRIAIVEKLRQMVRERSEEKAAELDQLLREQKLLLEKQNKRVMQEWLAYFMSEETMRKMRESFLSNPAMKRDVEQVGEELAKKGVLQQMQLQNKNELGGLSANVQQGKDQGKGQGQGRS